MGGFITFCLFVIIISICLFICCIIAYFKQKENKTYVKITYKETDSDNDEIDYSLFKHPEETKTSHNGINYDGLSTSFGGSSSCKTITKTISHTEKYSVIHKNSEFPDNMNHNYYVAKGVYKETRRKRTVKIEAFDSNEVREHMLSNGFEEPIDINQSAFPPPTPGQLETCNEHHTPVPNDACQHDVSAIISKEMDFDYVPNPELIHFATKRKIMFSYYIGKKALYDLIWRTLQNEDKIAFFAFCVYRYISDDRQADLDKSQYKDTFYQFAASRINDSSFIRSINRYEGRELRFFGNLTVNGHQSAGGSKNTIAYKNTVAYLKDRGLLA